jgi:hypothetical protein
MMRPGVVKQNFARVARYSFFRVGVSSFGFIQAEWNREITFVSEKGMEVFYFFKRESPTPACRGT